MSLLLQPSVLTLQDYVAGLSPPSPASPLAYSNPPFLTFQDYVAGLSWVEEKELKKALQVSLLESRRSSATQSRTDSPVPDLGAEEYKPAGTGWGRERKSAPAALGINPMMPPQTGNSGQSTPDTVRESNSVSSVGDHVNGQASSQCKL